ncbi:MAG TPA: amidoligase family protein [Pseudomonadales bacterium]|nr:amidoligase family protein [Pseudomonadales bacterium]
MTDEDRFPQPPQPLRADGETRRVGVEFEFAGLRPEAIVAAIRAGIGGQARQDSAVAWTLEDTSVGDLRLELDFHLLQKVAAEGRDERLPAWISEIGDWSTEIAERVASLVVPWEVVTGPIAVTDLHRLDAMVTSLREAGAQGTRQAPHFAFGVHLNPELPGLDARTVRDYFKAFLCLKDWLRVRCRPDLLRSLSPYISDFDDRWVREVVIPDYRPELPQFIDDYLLANPTRNRSMDMLPLLAHLDAERVFAKLDDPLIKSRPTLHYRLPNCEIDDPDWSLRAIWTDWIEVERLAADSPRLARMGDAYAQWLGRLRVPFDDGWAKETPTWLS